MANRRPLYHTEQRKIESCIREGWTKRKLCRHFHRSFELVTKIIAEMAPGNDDKIAVANALLTRAPVDPVDNIKKTLAAFSQGLRKQVPDLTSFYLNLTTGEVGLAFITNLNFKIGA